MNVLLDTVILIDFLGRVPGAKEYLRSVRGRSCVSVVTRAEVLAGIDVGERVVATALLDNYPLLPLDREAADRAGFLRRTERWKLPDAFQAALAQVHGLRLATRNTRDFPPDRYPFVDVPYRLGAG
jgi:predicted nucleic acid-binding protein